MKKFYYKKDAKPEETPILNRVGRRKTLMELAKEIKSDQWHEMAVRTLSGSSRPGSEDTKSRSNSSATSAFAVTESDLASSWIYTKRRDAANKMLEPQDSDLQQVNSSRRRCKTCRRVSLSSIIALCIIGILSAIGAIIYLEFFAPRQMSSDRGRNSVMLSGPRYMNGDSDLDDHLSTIHSDQEHTGYAEEFDFTKSTKTVLQPPRRRGKALASEEFTTPDNLLRTYVNGTINVMRNVFHMIKDTSKQMKNGRLLDTLENRQKPENFSYDGNQGLFHKLTNFLFGSVSSGTHQKIDRIFNTFSEPTTSSSVSYTEIYLEHGTEQSLDSTSNTDVMAELGSGDVDKSNTTSAEVDLSKTPLLREVYLREQMFEPGKAVLEDLVNKTDTISLQNLLDKFNNVFEARDLTTMNTSKQDVNLASPQSERESGLNGGQSSYSNIRSKFRASLEGLFKIFRAIDRITSPVTPPVNTNGQENLFQRRISKEEQSLTSETDLDFAAQERDQYLRRLRNMMFTDAER